MSVTATNQLRSLFRSFIRESRKYPNYNIREYIRRKSKEEFRDTVSNSGKDLESIQSDLEVVKRQAVVYSLYARKEKSIMDMSNTTSTPT
eukprot:jgi/Picsp_1/1075/NSC_04558-R1_pinus taeda anonymous locus 0_14360_01 genomic sequence